MRRLSQGIVAVVGSVALVASLSGCSLTNMTHAGQTVTGKITSIDGSKVTLQLGTIDEDDATGGSASDDGSDSATSATSGDANASTDGAEQATPDESAGSKGGSDNASSTDQGTGSAGDTQKPEDSGIGGEVPAGAPGGVSFTETDGTTTLDLGNTAVTVESGGGAGMPGGGAPADGEKPGDGSTSGSDAADSDDEASESDDQGTEGEANAAPDAAANSDDKTGADDAAKSDDEAPSGVGDGQGQAGSTSTESVSDLKEGDIVVVEIAWDGTVSRITLKGLSGSGPDSGTVDQGDAATTISEDGTYESQSYSSVGDDENALRVDGAEVTLTDVTVDKSSGSSSNTEDGDFYGMNAALLATNGATLTVGGGTVSSAAQNGNGIFSYGEGTTVNASNTKITTTADNSGGIQTTGGATTNARNLTVETSGNSSAAIRSDRGGGTVNVNGGAYTSSGYNSPAVYSTATIAVSDATLTANNSEALVIEGQNSIALTDCDVTGNMSDTKGTSSDTNVHNVMIYQSMSGDAEQGESSFSMSGGTLTSNNGDVFYVTNTDCRISLTGVDISSKDDDANLLTIAGNDASHGWGTAGSNGGNVEMTCSGQTLEGDITVDDISTLKLTLSDSSTLTGTVNIVSNAEGGTAVSDNAQVTIEKGCTWKLTGDCIISTLDNEGTIDFSGHTITLADGTVLSE